MVACEKKKKKRKQNHRGWASYYPIILSANCMEARQMDSQLQPPRSRVPGDPGAKQPAWQGPEASSFCLWTPPAWLFLGQHFSCLPVRTRMFCPKPGMLIDSGSLQLAGNLSTIVSFRHMPRSAAPLWRVCLSSWRGAGPASDASLPSREGMTFTKRAWETVRSFLEEYSYKWIKKTTFTNRYQQQVPCLYGSGQFIIPLL